MKTRLTVQPQLLCDPEHWEHFRVFVHEDGDCAVIEQNGVEIQIGLEDVAPLAKALAQFAKALKP